MEKTAINFKSVAHAKTYLRYHVIFSTKYRKKCLNEIREEVLAAFKYTESISDFKILEMEVDQDHIHFLLKIKPALSIAQVVRRLKQVSTNQLYKKAGPHLRKFFWRKNVLWTGGYFVATVGYVGEDVIKRYINNQMSKWHIHMLS